MNRPFIYRRKAQHRHVPTRGALLPYFFFCGTFLCITGCFTTPRPYTAPTADAVLSAIMWRKGQVHALRGEARMKHITPQGRVSATLRFIVTEPGALRFDLVSPFDTPLMTLVVPCANDHSAPATKRSHPVRNFCPNQSFFLVDARNNRTFTGPATPCNMARLLQVQLRPQDALPLLSGHVPIIDHDRRNIHWNDQEGVEVLKLSGSGYVQTIVLSGERTKRWDILRSEIRDPKGRIMFSTTATKFHTVDGIRLPRRLVISQPPTGRTLQLRFNRQEINPAIPAPAFDPPRLPSPPQLLDCDNTGPLPVEHKGIR